ncbi:lytic transglycosylase domain-containing protein, partial [uncultured Duncaniella sp.]
MKKILTTVLLGLGGAVVASAITLPSILELRHSITDDNIIAPESFETQTRLLEENFYLKNYVVPGVDLGNSYTATPQEYQERLAKLPTVIDLPYNSIVKNYIEMYLDRKRGLVADMLALHNYYGRFFEEELLKEGMPLELEYLPVIESAINPNAVSRAGAVGLWQFMPATAKGLGMEINSLVDERRDPRMSSRLAARYLKQLHDIYNDWSLAIAAYNCGPGNVNKALRRAGAEGEVKKDFWDIYDFLPAETRGYVPAFIAANYVMNYYSHHGISPTIVKRHLTTDTVQINRHVHFNQIAAVLNIPVDEIRMLNPQFLKDMIPGDYRPYSLTLPTQQCLSYI